MTEKHDINILDHITAAQREAAELMMQAGYLPSARAGTVMSSRSTTGAYRSCSCSG